MSHPNPLHDPENVRVDDNEYAPRAKAKDIARKMKVKSGPSERKYTKTVSRINGKTKVSFEPSEGYHKKAMAGLASSAWQKHAENKARRRGEK